MILTKSFLRLTAAILTASLAAATSGVPLAAQQKVSSSKNFKVTQQPAGAPFALPPVIARVNGAEIGIVQFWGRLINRAGSTVLTSLVDELLIEQEGMKKLGLTDAKGNKKKKKTSASRKFDREINKRFGDFRKQFKDEESFQQQIRNSGVRVEDIKKQLRINHYKEILLKDKMKVSKAEIKNYFDQNKEKLAVAEMVHLKHILVSTEQEAKDLELSVRVGASFELLAREKSLDQATRERGGDLGFFARGMLIPEIQRKAFSLKEGDVGIVKTNLGFHIIKVTEKKPAKDAAWDKETRKNIRRLIRQAKFNQEYPRLIQKLKSEADIQVLLNQ